MKKLLREYEALCALGLPPRELVPLAVGLMERIVPGTTFCFLRADARFAVIDCYMKALVPDALARLYARVFHDRLEGEAGPTFSGMLRDGVALVNYARQGARYLDSALYRRICQPLGVRHAVRVAVADGERRHGVLSALRPAAGRPFSARDEQVLLLLAGGLARALELEREARLVVDELSDRLDEGLLVLDPSGRVLHGCPLGLRLFHEATQLDGPGGRPSALRESLPATLVQRLRQTQPAGDLVLSNRHGEFGFRPFPMFTPTGREEGAPVGVAVHRRGSVCARLWRESARFELSPRERQIAVLLGAGYSYDAIASHLALSRNTAVSYVRRTYEKLGVTQREHLLLALLTDTH